MPNTFKLLMLALTMTACSRAEQAVPADTTATTAADSPSAQGSGGMLMPSGAMMVEMRARLRAQEGATGDSLRATLPRHRRAAANLVAQLNKEMRDMSMAPDAAWQALTDSVRQDLRQLPEMGGAELERAMASHGARLERLMGMHETMMKGM